MSLIEDKSFDIDSPSKDKIASFIRKTFQILEEAKHADIVDWSEDGLCIVIKNTSAFAEHVLPIYFKHNNFTSFVRQLNMYDFHKKKTLTTDHVYFNHLFQRGNKVLLQDIKRKSTEKHYKYHKNGGGLYQDKYILNGNYAENEKLSKLNQEALMRINILESQVNGLMLENDMLMKKIAEKQKKQEQLKSIISKYVMAEQDRMKPYHQNEQSNKQIQEKKNNIIIWPKLNSNSMIKELKKDNPQSSNERGFEVFKTKFDDVLDFHPESEKEMKENAQNMNLFFEDLSKKNSLNCMSSEDMKSFDLNSPMAYEHKNQDRF